MFFPSSSSYKPACLGPQSHSWCKFWVLRQDKDHQTQRVGAMAVLHWTTRNILSGSLAVTGNNQQEDLLTEVTENKIGTKLNAKIQRLPDCSMWRLHGFTGFTLSWPFQTSAVPSLHPAKWPFFMFQALLSRLKQNSNHSSISFVAFAFHTKHKPCLTWYTDHDLLPKSFVLLAGATATAAHWRQPQPMASRSNSEEFGRASSIGIQKIEPNWRKVLCTFPVWNGPIGSSKYLQDGCSLWWLLFYELAFGAELSHSWRYLDEVWLLRIQDPICCRLVLLVLASWRNACESYGSRCTRYVWIWICIWYIYIL